MNYTVDLGNMYTRIKTYVVDAGFEDEIRWQNEIDFEQMQETDFLRESAWVVLCSGMKVSVVQKCFKDISLCFYDWESSKKIVGMKDYCIEHALRHFRNYRKISAIAQIANIITTTGFCKIKQALKDSPIETLQTFPFIGPITAFHLAKNLGLPFAKTDRHLFRISKALGFSNAQTLCDYIAEKTGDTIQVVDIVLWRYATLVKNYLSEILQSLQKNFQLNPCKRSHRRKNDMIGNSPPKPKIKE